MTAEPGKVREPGTRALLDGFAVGDPDEVLRLRDLLAGLDRRVARARGAAPASACKRTTSPLKKNQGPTKPST